MVIAFGRYPLSIYSPISSVFPVLDYSLRARFFYPSVRMLGRHVNPEYAPAGSGSRHRLPAVIALSLWSVGTRRYSSTGS